MNFSIITVTKNNKVGLQRAIECVRNQTYKNIEHIIVDGGSIDGSSEILRSAQNESLAKTHNESKETLESGMISNNHNQTTTNYSLLAISEPDNGIYDAINKGIKLASGDVIGLLHSDDLYANENVIASVVDTFVNFNTDSVYCNLVYVNRTGKTIRVWNSGDYSQKKILNGWMPPHPTLFIRKEIFYKYGLYNTSYKIAADYEMILRLFWKYKINTHYLPVTIYLMSIGGTSNKSLKNIIQKSKEDLSALKLHNIPHPVITLLSKNFRKLPQLLTYS